MKIKQLKIPEGATSAYPKDSVDTTVNTEVTTKPFIPTISKNKMERAMKILVEADKHKWEPSSEEMEFIKEIYIKDFERKNKRKRIVKKKKEETVVEKKKKELNIPY